MTLLSRLGDPERYPAENMTRIATIVSLAVLLTATLFVGFVFTRNLLHTRAQVNVSHLNQQTQNVDAFPVVHSHSLVDRYGNPKIILLHKSSRPTTKVPFYWVDLIAIDPPDRHLRCIVNGYPVEIESDIQVFSVTDDSKPIQRSFESGTIVPHTPIAKWKSFVDS